MKNNFHKQWILITCTLLIYTVRVFAGGDIFIENGTILTVTSGIIENGSILIKNGKIVQIGKGLKSPRGVTVINAKGKYVMPGIIDSHCHIAIEGGVNESTQAVTSEVKVEDVIRHDDPAIYRYLTEGVTSVMTLHGSANIIGGQNAVLKLKYGKSAEQLLIKDAKGGIKMALGENQKTKGRRRHPSYPEGRLGIAHILKNSFIEAKEYIRKWDEYKNKIKSGKIAIPPKKDLRLEAITDVLKGNLKIHCHCYRADEILMVMKTCEEFGVKILSFEHCLEGYKVADEIAKHGAIPSIFVDHWAYKIEAFDSTPYNSTILNERGAKVAINSDGIDVVRRLYHEAAKTVKYGVPEEDALKMITIYPAEIIGIEDRAGSIEIGKDGDIAIFSHHPLSVYTKCEKTIIEGEIYFDIDKAKTTEKILKETVPVSYGTGGAR